VSSVRVHALLRAGYGSLLLCCPTQMIDLLRAPRDDAAAITLSRVLGVRHLAQAALTIIAPARKVVVVGAVVDALHGLSDVAVALTEARWRPAASIDAAVAFTSAGVAVRRRTTSR